MLGLGLVNLTLGALFVSLTCTGLAAGLRNLFADDHYLVYGDLRCPLEDDQFSSDAFALKTGTRTEAFLLRAKAAQRLSINSNAERRVTEVLRSKSLDHRRIVFVGDYGMRQKFISLGCLIGSDSIEASVAPWRTDGAMYSGKRIDSRVRLVGSGELIYSPMAGGLMNYDWRDDGNVFPLEAGSVSWIDACRDGSDFIVNTFAYRGHGQEISLEGDDVVFINAGTHSTRNHNQNNTAALLTCIDRARLQGKANPSWPNIHYVVTSIDHDALEKEDKAFGMCKSHEHSNLHHHEDQQLYISHGGIVAGNVDLKELGNLHVVDGNGDCTNWLQPGVPDLLAADMAEMIMTGVYRKEG